MRLDVDVDAGGVRDREAERGVRAGVRAGRPHARGAQRRARGGGVVGAAEVVADRRARRTGRRNRDRRLRARARVSSDWGAEDAGARGDRGAEPQIARGAGEQFAADEAAEDAAGPARARPVVGDAARRARLCRIFF